MKKSILCFLAVMLLTAAAGEAAQLSLIPKLGIAAPLGNHHVDMKSSYYISATGLYKYQREYYLEASVGYMPVNPTDDWNELWENIADYSGSLITLLAGARKYSPGGDLYIEGGGGLYLYSVNFHDESLGATDLSESFTGGYGAAGYIPEENIEINGTFHWPNFDAFLFNLNVGYKFDLSGLR
ncbi:MAG: hypothetical protein U9R36_05540 [Elusimicrobiota bacterium]|nr:hypothetical protein [Elusimicrobiota bacterium]